MRQIRQVLRLHLEAGLTYAQVGRALDMPKSTVGKFALLARAAGVDWPTAQNLDDDELQARLFRPAVPRAARHLEPDYVLIHQQLKGPGVTLQLLWQEYAQANPLAYKYTSFCSRLADRRAGVHRRRAAFDRARPAASPDRAAQN